MPTLCVRRDHPTIMNPLGKNLFVPRVCRFPRWKSAASGRARGRLSMMNNRQALRHITDILRTAVAERTFEGLVRVIRNEAGFTRFQAVS